MRMLGNFFWRRQAAERQRPVIFPWAETKVRAVRRRCGDVVAAVRAARAAPGVPVTAAAAASGCSVPECVTVSC